MNEKHNFPRFLRSTIIFLKMTERKIRETLQVLKRYIYFTSLLLSAIFRSKVYYLLETEKKELKIFSHNVTFFTELFPLILFYTFLA